MEKTLETITTLNRSGENLEIVISYSGGDRPLSGQGYILTKEGESISDKYRSGALLQKRQDLSLVIYEDFGAGWAADWSTSNDLLLDDVVMLTEITNGLRVECTGAGDSSFFYLFLSESDYLDNLFMEQDSDQVVARLTGRMLTAGDNRYLDFLFCRPTQEEPYTFKVEGNINRVNADRDEEKPIAEILEGELTGVVLGEYSGSTVAVRFRLNVPLIFEINTVKVNTNE